MLDHTQLKQLGLFDARVPRYTSYPTAPHFAASVGAGDVATWLQAVPAGASVSVYVHVPFCRNLCWFCACRTQGTTTAAPVAAYVETLKAELQLAARHLAKGVTIEHLHFGGGTPTLMEPDMIADLTGAIFDMAPLAEGAQFSVEIDPNEIDDARLDALAAAGLNRASIGVQDFDPMIQEVIGRPQSFEVTRAAVESLRARGITSLNADILYGLPFQDLDRITDSVNKLIGLGPDRVALFGYAHVPWMARRQKLIPTEALPSPEERLELFDRAHELFTRAGYRQIGIDHFALPDDGLSTAQQDGTIRRNFQGYTEDKSEVLIGFGASSISRYPQGYAQNEPATSKYTGRVQAGELPVAKGHAFAGDDKIRARIIELLLCDFAVDFAKVAAQYDTGVDALIAMAEGLETNLPGTTEMNGTTLTIHPSAWPLARIIARHFDAYDMNASGHSQAV